MGWRRDWGYIRELLDVDVNIMSQLGLDLDLDLDLVHSLIPVCRRQGALRGR